ncbi:MAG: universal stress protein [Bacteriovorax sp.]|nr:universal stress protein [Bacteriovorax sp.]
MKTAVICVDLNDQSLETLKTIPAKLDLQEAQIHLIHVVEIQYADHAHYSIVYPIADEYPEIEKNVFKALTKLAEDVKLPENRIVKKCVFSHSKKEALKDYLIEVHADVVIVATRGKHGVGELFPSSLTDFLCKYSPCAVLVLRPPKQLIFS